MTKKRNEKKSLFWLMYLILCIMFPGNRLHGEDNAFPIDVNDLKTPTAPAFSLLGIEPTSIDQPKTPRAFVLSLLNARAQSDFLPKDYAMQVAPYWLVQHPTLTFDDYYKANVVQTLLQTAVISVATSKMSLLDSLSMGTSLGAGLNVLLIQGKVNPELWNLKDSIKRKHDSILTIIDSGPNISKEDSVVIDTLNNQIKIIVNKIQAMDKVRTGCRLEIAGASVVDFSNDKFESGKMTRYGVWILPAYRISNSTLDIIALGRYIHNESDSSENYLDFGGRIVSETSDFTLSGEFVYRMIKRQANQNDESYRANVSMEYQLNPSIRVIGSFGRNFKTNKSDLIAFLGVNLGFGQIPVLSLNK